MLESRKLLDKEHLKVGTGQRQVSATSRFVCSASKQVTVTRACSVHTAYLEEWECKLVFQFNMVRIHGTLSLVNLNFVAATCHGSVYTL